MTPASLSSASTGAFRASASSLNASFVGARSTTGADCGDDSTPSLSVPAVCRAMVRSSSSGSVEIAAEMGGDGLQRPPGTS